LNSRPGSDRTIFLDFDGHTVPADTAWDDPTYGNGGNPLVAGTYPAFTLDGDGSFSDAEKRAIIDAWSAVSEDYAIFDVNVTTQDPGDDAINRSDLNDEVYGTRALVTEGTNSWDANICACGGIAYGDVFGMSFGQPAFVFVSSDYQSVSNFDGKLIADVASHEVGHNLNLDHDGSSSDGEYFLGIDDGKNWAPIMGGGYYNGVVQWSDGDYEGATQGQNDIALISAAGAPLLNDESNISKATASVISATAIDGVINSSSDVDVFKVVISGGVVGIYSYSPTDYSNLDTKLTLLDSNFKTLFSTDALSVMTEDSNGIGGWPVSGMDGVLNADLPNGTYYIKLEGVGRSGAYSDYGSVGAYSIKTRTPSAATIPTKGTPTISGTKRKGRTLTGAYGTWTSGTAFVRQWLRDGVVISGATSKTYVLTAADVGHKIQFRVIATKGSYRKAIKVSAKTVTITN
jgi:hypothetical protein